MSSIAAGNAEQYGDSRKLSARAGLHKYSTAEPPWFSWVAQQLPLKAGDRVLDIGCGPAWFWAATARALPSKLDLTLADMSPGMVREAMERCRPLPFGTVSGRQADAAAMPFEDGEFDAVVAMHMLYHLADPAIALAEMHRVLKPGGFLAVTTNGAGNMREIYELATVLGSAPTEPSAAVFGLDIAERSMRSRFGDVAIFRRPAELRITDPDDVLHYLTSFPPGDGASEDRRAALREAIRGAFHHGNGTLQVRTEAGLLLSRKAA